MNTKLVAAAAVLIATTGLASCGSSSDAPKANATKVVVGSFGFSESETLALIYGGALKHAGIEVTYKLKLGPREVVAPALAKGDIDLVPEYLGNYLAFLDKNQSKGLPAAEATKKLKDLAGAKGLTVAEVSAAADGDVLAVTSDFAQQNHLTKISDLSTLKRSITLAGPSECETRETCFLGLQKDYGLKVTFLSTADDAGGPVTKTALTDSTADVGRLFSSDPDVAPGGKFVVLEDDKVFQQAGNVVPVIGTAKASSAVLEILGKVSKALTTDKLIDLDRMTDVDKVDPQKVADLFLAREKL